MSTSMRKKPASNGELWLTVLASGGTLILLGAYAPDPKDSLAVAGLMGVGIGVLVGTIATLVRRYRSGRR